MRKFIQTTGLPMKMAVLRRLEECGFTVGSMSAQPTSLTASHCLVVSINMESRKVDGHQQRLCGTHDEVDLAWVFSSAVEQPREPEPQTITLQVGRDSVATATVKEGITAVHIGNHDDEVGVSYDDLRAARSAMSTMARPVELDGFCIGSVMPHFARGGFMLSLRDVNRILECWDELNNQE